MKKKTLLMLLTIMLSTFFIKCVSADTIPELSCVYGKSTNGMFDFANDSYFMLVQNSNGERSLKISLNKLKPEDKNWSQVTSMKEMDFSKTKEYNGNYLTDCPGYLDEDNQTYAFYDEEDKSFIHKDNRPKVDEAKKAYEDTKGQVFEGDYTSEINSTEWLAKCSYEDVDLYFNNDKYILQNKKSFILSSVGDFTLSELLTDFKSSRVCPRFLYSKSLELYAGHLRTTYYLRDEESGSHANRADYSNSTVYSTEVSEDKIETTQRIPGSLCNETEVKQAVRIIGIIIKIVTWVAPIILIVLGMIDFGKAAISSDDKAMKKAGTDFVKRLVAGLCIFIVPNVIIAIVGLIEDFQHFESTDSSKSTFAACTKCLFDPFNKCNVNSTIGGAAGRDDVLNSNSSGGGAAGRDDVLNR